METLKLTPTEKTPREKEEDFVIPEHSRDRPREFVFDEPDWKKDGWSVERAFEEPAQSNAAAAREVGQIREITAGLGEAPKEYEAGVIAERLSGGYEGSTEPIAPAQLEHFYKQSKSPEPETQQALSENLRGLSRAQIAQWAEYLAARKAAAQAETETTEKDRWSITGNLDDTSPNPEFAPEKALSHEQMELIHNLGSVGLEASGSAFKEQLKSLTPAQAEQLMDYLLSREENTAESARIIHRMSPEQQDAYFDKRNTRNSEKIQSLSTEAQAQAETAAVESEATIEAPQVASAETSPLTVKGELSPEQLEMIHVTGLSDSKENFGRQVNALTAEQYDQLMAYRARRILNPNSGSSELGTELSPEQADTSNGSPTAVTVRPSAPVDTLPKRRWWNIFGRRRGRKNNS